MRNDKLLNETVISGEERHPSEDQKSLNTLLTNDEGKDPDK
jgi:hypothetical protein